MRAILTVEMDGSAFGETPLVELARILRKEVELLEAEAGVFPATDDVLGVSILRDSNGNRVGELKIEEDPPAMVPAQDARRMRMQG